MSHQGIPFSGNLNNHRSFRFKMTFDNSLLKKSVLLSDSF